MKGSVNQIMSKEMQQQKTTVKIRINEPSGNNNNTNTLVIAILTAFLTTFSGSALNLSIPAIDNEFNAGAAAIGWVISGYILAAAAFSVPIGRMADLTGRERILKAGILVFSISCGAICFVGTMEALLLFRVTQGIGAAMVFSTNQAVLISRYPPEKRGKVLGFFIAATYTGLTTGPVLGGIMNHAFGWRSIFLLTLVVGLVTFGLAVKNLRNLDGNVEVSRQKMDLLGSILFIISILSMMYGLSALTAVPFAKYLIILSIGWFLVFIRHELHIENPVVQIRLFRKNSGYLLSNLAALLNYSATFAVGYLMSIYLQVIRGFDSQVAGLILISQPLIMALLSPYTGRLSDRISPHKLASFGMGLCALGLLLFIFVTKEMPLSYIISGLFIVGLGFAFFSSPNTNAVMSCVEPADYGVASSILATMRNLGHSSGMAVLTFIIVTFLGNIPLAQADPYAILYVMRISFTVFTCLCVVGVFISLKRNNAV